jgi:hypothetical protein
MEQNRLWGDLMASRREGDGAEQAMRGLMTRRRDGDGSEQAVRGWITTKEKKMEQNRI